MIRYENDCCDCDVAGYPCNDSCTLRHNPHYFCDECNEECDVNELYKYDIDATELCATCLLGKFKTVG